MKNRQEILRLLEANREKIKSFGVKNIGLFGSVARGDNTESSDVDILVELSRETFSDYMNLLFFLEELFGVKVDLVMKDAIKPIIKERILSETIYVENI
jgi:predicted nucleotidyltransferase